jgi:Undecaprenyl-phosphate glucose phosphotransferase
MIQLLDKDTKLIKAIISIGDLLCFSISFILIHWITQNYHIFDNPKTILKCLLLMYLCYIPSITIFPSVVYSHIVRIEQIFIRVFGVVSTTIGFLTLIVAITWWSPISYRMIFLYILSFILLLSWRLFMRKMIKVSRLWNVNSTSLVFVGYGFNLNALYKEFTSNTLNGYRIKGYFNDTPVLAFENKIPHLGTVKDVSHYLGENPVDELYCTLQSSRENEIKPIIHYCENNMVRFFSVPNVRNYLIRQMSYTLIGNVPVLSIRKEPLLIASNRVIKRLLDLFISGLFLITLYWPIYIIIGIIIKFTSPGPVYFKQERSGMNGNVFLLYKFRSMKVNHVADELQATKDDPRKTKFGNFIRKTSIDELPQFLNVWRGEMSIVGPRPHMLKHTEEYSALIDKFMVRHLAKPGITGWAQVNGFRGETRDLSDMEARVEKDIWYIENWSFFLDLRIIAQTALKVFWPDQHAY